MAVRSSRVTTGVVAVAVGEGLRALLHGLGVQQVVAGGQSMNPSTAQILDAVEHANADGVIVLPNNKNIVPVAQQVADLADVPVAVVPTAAVVEALGALVAYDPAASLEVNQAAMADAAGRGAGRRGHPGRPRQRRRVRADRHGRLDRHHPRRHPRRR